MRRATRRVLDDNDRQLLAAFEAAGATKRLTDEEASRLLDDLRRRLGILNDPPDTLPPP